MDGIDVTRNILYLTGDIIEDTVSYFISRVNYLVEQNKDKEILVYINSYGGDIYSAFGIIDYMRVCEVKIGIACYGAATSAAALILVNATGEKIMSKNSYLMFHPPWIEKDEDIDEKHMKDLKNKILNNLEEQSNKGKRFWNNKLKDDYYMNAKQCLEMRLIHRVLSY
ncbi:MAG: ATP-dependent Clp protease proteolytic subunit [Pelagibacterales bacterium]|nr:ATP-dependent Clp protease proteolytic subunit [Pelagibacterales bacterium]